MKYKFICEECGKMFDTAAAAEQCEAHQKSEREQREAKQRKIKEIEKRAEKMVTEMNYQLKESGSHLRAELVGELKLENCFSFTLF